MLGALRKEVARGANQPQLATTVIAQEAEFSPTIAGAELSAVGQRSKGVGTATDANSGCMARRRFMEKYSICVLWVELSCAAGLHRHIEHTLPEASGTVHIVSVKFNHYIRRSSRPSRSAAQALWGQTACPRSHTLAGIAATHSKAQHAGHMTHATSISAQEFAERYVGVWNEASPEARRTLIRELWSEQVSTCCSRQLRCAIWQGGLGSRAEARTAWLPCAGGAREARVRRLRSRRQVRVPSWTSC
jgi:hypothetical protein